MCGGEEGGTLSPPPVTRAVPLLPAAATRSVQQGARPRRRSDAHGRGRGRGGMAAGGGGRRPGNGGSALRAVAAVARGLGAACLRRCLPLLRRAAAGLMALAGPLLFRLG